MWYLVLIIVFIVIVQQVEKRTLRWETIVKYLWKQIYQLADLMASEINSGSNEILYMERCKKTIGLRGNIINSVLDFVNYLEKEKDESAEEETFGYGRYNFDTILNTAKSDPSAFKKLNN